MRAKLHTLDIEELLRKNPTSAKVFKDNKKKLASMVKGRRHKEYGIGLPYDRSNLMSSSESLEAEFAV